MPRAPGPRSRASTVLLAAALLLATWASGCSEAETDGATADFVQRSGSRLVKVQSVGLAAFGPINPHTAIASDAELAFGQRSFLDRNGELCRRRWPGLGLTIYFADPRAGDPCGSQARIEEIRLAGPAAAKAGWRTAEGIRPGMSLAAARRIYPDARRDSAGRLALVEPLGREEAMDDPVLAATTAGGRLVGLSFSIGAVSDG